MSLFLPAWLSFSDLKALEAEDQKLEENESDLNSSRANGDTSRNSNFDSRSHEKKNVGLSVHGLRHRANKKRV